MTATDRRGNHQQRCSQNRIGMGVGNQVNVDRFKGRLSHVQSFLTPIAVFAAWSAPQEGTGP